MKLVFKAIIYLIKYFIILVVKINIFLFDLYKISEKNFFIS